MLDAPRRRGPAVSPGAWVRRRGVSALHRAARPAPRDRRRGKGPPLPVDPPHADCRARPDVHGFGQAELDAVLGRTEPFAPDRLPFVREAVEAMALAALTR